MRDGEFFQPTILFESSEGLVNGASLARYGPVIVHYYQPASDNHVKEVIQYHFRTTIEIDVDM